MIKIKRAYVRADPSDERRVLVERLWPRGVKKEDLQLDDWMKEVSPSPELRRWYSHDVEKWPEFKQRYLKELANRPEAMQAVERLRLLAKAGNLTLVYAAKDELHNSALLLKEYLEQE